MKKTLLIVNPKAGKMKAKGSMFDVVETLSKSDFRVTIEITKRQGHATELARDSSGEFDLIVCVGGDGTLNEVVSGVIDSEKPLPIGYIPSGSTNDFAATLGLSKKPKDAAQDIVDGIETKLDVGLFGDKYFTYVASFGAFTSASYNTPQNVKNALGHLAYVLQGVCDIPSIRSEKLRIETDTGRVYEGSYLFGAISNTTSVGGLISLDERIVTMNDGCHELLLVKSPKNIADLNRCISAILSQNYSNSDVIELDSLSSATVTSENAIVWSLDGERAETDGSVSIRNISRAVTMILPRSTVSSSLLCSN